MLISIDAFFLGEMMTLICLFIIFITTHISVVSGNDASVKGHDSSLGSSVLFSHVVI